jgi:predicted nucleic acid-binding protein
MDYVLRRSCDRSTADEVLSVIDRLPIEVIDVGRSHARAAAQFKARGGLSYANCFAAGLAQQADGPVITGDPEFEQIENDIEVLWLE